MPDVIGLYYVKISGRYCHQCDVFNGRLHISDHAAAIKGQWSSTTNDGSHDHCQVSDWIGSTHRSTRFPK